jgi:hypothetical protein
MPMLTNVAQPGPRESATLVWILVARSIGVSAGVGIALLAMAALLSAP